MEKDIIDQVGMKVNDKTNLTRDFLSTEENVKKNNQSLDANNICHQVGNEGVNCPIKVNRGNVSHQFWVDIPYACYLNNCIPSSMFNEKISLFYFTIKIFTLYFLHLGVHMFVTVIVLILVKLLLVYTMIRVILLHSVVT